MARDRPRMADLPMICECTGIPRKRRSTRPATLTLRRQEAWQARMRRSLSVQAPFYIAKSSQHISHYGHFDRKSLVWPDWIRTWPNFATETFRRIGKLTTSKMKMSLV
ncbi:hypothetical protein BGLA2_1510030 [Burkholderia gladioli]|nr:hypothetical protein BGLA2_1510030 [Burkholderia gladioli]